MYHGVVEGFYGKPFSAGQRKILFDELSPVDGAAYLYAPKDDPWHRLRWKELYPNEKWRLLKSFMGGKVAFFFSVSPWKFKDTEWRAAREKLLRARDAGAAGLSLLFDDVPESSAGKLAERQLNFALRALEDVDVPVILCPSVYCGEFLERFSGGAEYLRVWKEMIPQNWSSFWTGPQVVSEKLSDLLMAEELLGSKPVVWDNILATDYSLRRVYLAGLSGRISDSYSWFINPSEIFPAALYGVMQFRSAMGLKRSWPEALGKHNRGWELMREFHHLPWRAGVAGEETIAKLAAAIDGRGVDDALMWLQEAVSDMTSFLESLPSIEGGWQLLPLARDMYRSLSIIKRALETDEPRKTLDYFMYERLPYENPVAALAAGKK